MFKMFKIFLTVTALILCQGFVHAAPAQLNAPSAGRPLLKAFTFGKGQYSASLKRLQTTACRPVKDGSAVRFDGSCLGLAGDPEVVADGVPSSDILFDLTLSFKDETFFEDYAKALKARYGEPTGEVKTYFAGETLVWQGEELFVELSAPFNIGGKMTLRYADPEFTALYEQMRMARREQGRKDAAPVNTGAALEDLL